MSTHRKFGGSSAHRWLQCSMSVVGYIGVEEKENEAAAEGTKAHEYAACVLTGEEPTFTPTTEMADGVMVYVEEVVGLAKPGTELIVEQSFGHPADDRVGGTADAIIWDAEARHLTVFDFKFGYKRVEVENNAQLLLYALGFVLNRGVSPVDITLGIVQPRAPHSKGPTRYASTDLLTLLEFNQDVLRAVARADEAPVEVVGDHCLYCPRAALCPALRASNQIVIGEAEGLARGVILSPERLAELVTQIPRAQAMLKALWDFAASQLARGIAVPGFALDADSFGHRKWINWDSAKAFLVAHGVSLEALYKQEPISPAQAEKLLSKEDKAQLKSYAKADRLPPKMVPENQAKSPVVGAKATDVFKRVETYPKGS